MNKKIGIIGSNMEAIRADVQEVICSAAGHAYEHGDVTAFSSLIKATTGVNQKRIMAWIRANGFAIWSKDKDEYVLNQSAVKNADFEDGHAVALYLFTEVPAWYTKVETPSEIDKELDAIARISRLRKDIAKGDKIVKVDFEAFKAEMEGLLDDVRKCA
jgi:hypothetical protein